MTILSHFQHLTLSSDQETAIKKLEDFIASPTQVFLLKGYAGSGKTTILKGLVEYLDSIDKNFALMAPTGRAAKVIREKTSKDANTIHRSIYSYEDMVETEEGDSFFYSYNIRNNIDIAGVVFIVDEASMVSDNKSESEFFRFGTGHLLSDLFTYSRITSPNVNSKIIFVGDPCQLPPVGDNSSKAFDIEYLSSKFNVSVEETEMKEVKRQSGVSGILKAAARIRKSISSGFFNDFNLRSNGNDILNPSGSSLLDIWERTEGTKIIVANKNKTCLKLNLQIRERRFGNADLPVQISDIVIMGSNNYGKGVFNGEFAVVSYISELPTSRTIHLKGKSPVILTWRDVELVFPDSGTNNKIIKGKVLENFLYGDNYLKPEETQALYVDFTTRHKALRPKSEEFKLAIMQDEYFNCLRMKYGYAVTCHKAQGGEWDNVFTIWDNDNTNGFDCLTDKQVKTGKTNETFYRWAYTAITRASKTLFALNPPFFNSYSSMSFLDLAVIASLNELTGKQLQTEEIEIDLDNDILQDFSDYNLLEQPIQIQDHFIKVRYAVRKQYIEIIAWEKKNLEVFYTFKREDKTAAVKTWVNKENIFNGKFQKLPNKTNNEDFYVVVESLLKNLPNVNIKRNTVETIVKSIEFEFELEEAFPITRNLFDDISHLLEDTKICIDDLEHMQYKERYTFKRNQEVAVIDFEYNQDCFLGRIVPIQSKTNSQQLFSDIRLALQTINQD